MKMLLINNGLLLIVYSVILYIGKGIKKREKEQHSSQAERHPHSKQQFTSTSSLTPSKKWQIIESNRK